MQEIVKALREQFLGRVAGNFTELRIDQDEATLEIGVSNADPRVLEECPVASLGRLKERRAALQRTVTCQRLKLSELFAQCVGAATAFTHTATSTSPVVTTMLINV